VLYGYDAVMLQQLKMQDMEMMDQITALKNA